MKSFWIALTLFASAAGYGQDSYEFVNAMPPSEKPLKSIESDYYGLYTADSNASFYEFNPDGIFINSVIYSSISKKDVRESSKYKVRNGHIFGVVKNDSLPCFLENDKYYFGIKQRKNLLDPSLGNVLKKQTNSCYYLNYKEGNYFVPCMLKFKGETVSISFLDYDSNSYLFRNVIDRKEVLQNNQKTVELNLADYEWTNMDKEELYPKALIFRK